MPAAVRLKTHISGLLGYMFAITLKKTVNGLQQAAHPMVILNSILLYWTKNRMITTCHLHLWQLVRESLLYNDVKFILDRFENVVLAYLGVAFWLISDSTFQIVVQNVPPTLLAAYTLLLMWAATGLCVTQAFASQNTQEEHLFSLTRVKESTLLQSGHFVERQQKLVEWMIERYKSGGDYQTKLLYVPLNPKLQKLLVGYVLVAGASVLGRLLSNSFLP